MAMSWRAQEAIRNLVIVAVTAGGIFALYLYLRSGDVVEQDECEEERNAILEVCAPICEDKGEQLVPLHDVQHGKEDPQCLEKCSKKRFRRALPICDSRR